MGTNDKGVNSGDKILKRGKRAGEAERGNELVIGLKFVFIGKIGMILYILLRIILGRSCKYNIRK
jgi:preprotein translocase subunit Sss1